MPEQAIESSSPFIEALSTTAIHSAQAEDIQTDGAIRSTPVQSSDNRKRKRLKKMRIGDALRVEGLDEREVAQKFRGVIERQIPTSEGQETNDKLLVDMLLNCFRYLDDGPRPVASGGGRPAKLLHRIPRPNRAPITKIRTGKGG
jgi:hypothetical protein